MKERVLNKWQKALTSGKYKKITNDLHREGKGDKTLCCVLGVLCDIHRMETKEGQWDGGVYLGETCELPEEVTRWSGIGHSNPPVLMGDNQVPLTKINDETNTSFKKFAEILGKSQEAHLLGPVIKDRPRRKKKQQQTTQHAQRKEDTMSYTRLGQLILTDIASLRKAVIKNSNLEWVEGATKYQHEYSERNCVHKIKVVGKEPGSYEIGVIENPDGPGYKLVWDSAAGFEGVIGKGASIINTDYTREVSRDFAAKNGYILTETQDKDGQIILTMTN